MDKLTCALLAILVAGAPAGVCAGEADLPVPVQQYESIRYYSGGVGIEERTQLPQLFALRVILATDSGKLLCNAEVTILTKEKTVFRGRAEHGPWLFVDLPPGVYDIKALQGGHTREAKGVRLVKGGHQTVVLRWKASEVGGGL